MALKDRTTYDDQLFTSEERENSGQNSKTKCNCSPFSKRYIISVLALLGFANVYALRVNLSVALVAMVTKTSTLNEEGKTVKVQMKFNFITNRAVLVSRKWTTYFPKVFLPKLSGTKVHQDVHPAKAGFCHRKWQGALLALFGWEKSLQVYHRHSPPHPPSPAVFQASLIKGHEYNPNSIASHAKWIWFIYVPIIFNKLLKNYTAQYFFQEKPLV